MGDTRTIPRRALVLAGGGVVGGLYEVGAMIALDALCDGFTTCEFDLYVGSSAGAFVASLLANGVSPTRIRATLESDRRTLPMLTGSRFLSLPWQRWLETIPRLAAAVPDVGRELWVHWREALVLDSLGTLLRHLPDGLFTLEGFEDYVRGILTRSHRTNDFRQLGRRLLVPATNLDTGAIHVFGDAPNDPTPISAAVAASAAVPLLFAPVRIDGIDYVDAAITKTAHSSLAVQRGARLVVVVNPIRPLVLNAPSQGRIRDGGVLGIASQALRILLQRRLHDGLLRFPLEHPDTDLILLEPYERDLQLFDTSLMTYSMRHEIVRRGYRTTIKTILADFPRYQTMFARHGVGVVSRSEVERRAEAWSSVYRRVA